MTTTIQIHHGEALRVQSVFYDNARAFTLEVVRTAENGGNVEFVIYNLPRDYVERVIAAFGEPVRCSFIDQQSVYPQTLKSLKEENDRLKNELHAIKATKLETT